MGDVLTHLAQLAKKELVLAVAMAMKRFPKGSELEPARSAAEREYAEALQAVGTKIEDAAILAMAAEAYMNLSPWDYYQVHDHLFAFMSSLDQGHGMDRKTAATRVHFKLLSET